MSPLQFSERLREVDVAAAPDVDELGVGQAQAFGDLGGADEIIDVDLASHRANARRAVVDGPTGPCHPLISVVTSWAIRPSGGDLQGGPGAALTARGRGRNPTKEGPTMVDDTRPHPRGVTEEDAVLPAGKAEPDPDGSAEPHRGSVPMEVWADFVRYARHHRGLSQDALAAAACTSQQTISKIESGELCPQDRLKARLSEALDIPTGLLFPWPPRFGPVAEEQASGGSEGDRG